jgi:hypothetical protein
MKILTNKKLLLAILLVIIAVAAYFLHTKYVVKKAVEKSDAIGSNFTVKLTKE